jgi:hypothetical protein
LTNVNTAEIKTNDCRFNFDEVKLFYDYLIEGSTSAINFQYKFKLLPDQQKIFVKHKKKMASQKKKKQKQTPNPHMRVPAFLCEDFVTYDICNHFYEYFRLFLEYDSIGIDFAHSPILGHHLVALKTDIQWEFVRAIKENIMPTEHIGTRSVYSQGTTPAYLLGVASYVSHGCSAHTHFTLPGQMSTTAYTKFKLNEVKFAHVRSFPCILRVRYSANYFSDQNIVPICELPGCFASKLCKNK